MWLGKPALARRERPNPFQGRHAGRAPGGHASHLVCARRARRARGRAMASQNPLNLVVESCRARLGVGC